MEFSKTFKNSSPIPVLSWVQQQIVSGVQVPLVTSKQPSFQQYNISQIPVEIPDITPEKMMIDSKDDADIQSVIKEIE
jgi:hypothetical protein